MHPPEYDELMEHADLLPWGREELATVQRAVRIAEAAGDELLEYETRLRLGLSAAMANDTEALLTSIGWCLARHDADPDRFPLGLGGNAAQDLMWQYKWVPTRLASSSVFSRGQITDALADLQRRFCAAGLGPSGFLVTKFRAEWYLGETEAAELSRRQLVLTPRDSHSHCEACTHSEYIEFFAATGRDAEAVDELDAMMAGDAQCGDEPERAMSLSLLPLLRVGRFAEARVLHRRGYPMAARHEGEIDMIAGHLLFLAVTGNEADALAMLERHLLWLVHDALNDRGLFLALAAAAVVCEVIAEAGHGELTVSGMSDPALARVFGRDPAGTGWTVARTGAVAREKAHELADRFDARNGNDGYRQWLATILDCAAERYDVPLEVRPFRPESAEGAEPSDSAGWLRRAQNLAANADPAAALEAAGRVGDDVSLEDLDGTWSVMLWALGQMGRLDEAAEVNARRVERLRELGADDEADSASRVGLALLGLDDGDEQVLLDEIERLDSATAATGRPPVLAMGSPRALAALLVGVVTIRMRAERWDEAVDMADRTIEVNLRAERSVSGSLMRRLVIALAREEDSDTIRQMATELAESTDFDLGRAFGLQLLARFDGGAQDYAAGAAKADAAVAIVVAAGLRDRARELGQLAGDLWLDAGDAREAAARYRFAIQQADLGEQRKDALVLSLGRALVLAGETDQALETLDPLVWREDDDDPLVVAHALSWIARAYESEGDLAEAGEQWEEAIAAFTQAGQLDDAAAAALRAGRLARIEDEPSDAVGYLDSAVELGTRSGEAHQVVFEAMCEIATLQAETGDTSAVESIEEALRLAEAAEAPWAIAEATDTKARILIQLDRLTESVSLCLQASDLYREAGDAGAAGGAEYTAGQVLMHLGRSTEAVSLLRQALDAPENQPGFLDAVRVLLADALEATGADDEARHLRRLVEAGLPDTVEEPGD